MNNDNIPLRITRQYTQRDAEKEKENILNLNNWLELLMILRRNKQMLLQTIENKILT